MNNTQEKLDALMSDNAFVTEFVKNIDDNEKLVALFAENDVDLTAEEIAEFAAIMKKQATSENSGELSEEDMESVSGGIILGTLAGMAAGYYISSRWLYAVSEVWKTFNPGTGGL